MENNLDHGCNQQKEIVGNESVAAAAAPDANASRRQFTRQAIVGSAVLFSLGNRPAWSQTPDCISANTYASWAAGTHASHHPDADYTGYTLNEQTGEYCKPQ